MKKRGGRRRRGGRRKVGGAMSKYKSVMNIAKRVVKDVGIGQQLRKFRNAVTKKGLSKLA